MVIVLAIVNSVLLIGFVLLVIEYGKARKLVSVYKMAYTNLHNSYEALDKDYEKVVEYIVEKHKDDPKRPAKKKHKENVNRGLAMTTEQYQKLLDYYKRIKQGNTK